MTTISGHTTRANGTILTAAIYNADHVNHVTNAQNLNAEKMEGATPPVVDGQAVVWDGTSGSLLRTGGYFPANQLRSVLAGTGLLGGGDLTADRTLSVDFASQAEAEAAASAAKVMSPLRASQFYNIMAASQAEAEAGANNTKWMSPLRVQQKITFSLASQAQAEAGTDPSALMTPLRVAQEIAAFGGLNIGSALVTFSGSSVWDTGVVASRGGVFMLIVGGDEFQISMNGGVGYTASGVQVSTSGALPSGFLLVFAKGNKVAFFGTTVFGGTPQVWQGLLTPTGPTGNIFMRTSGGDVWQGVRVM